MIKEIESTLLTQKLDLPLTSSITVMMFFATILSISCYSVIAPFLPSEFDRRNIDEVIVGLVFAVFSLAVIFGSPIMGYIIQRYGRRYPLIFGGYLLSVSLLMLGLLTYIESNLLFIMLSFVARVLQGIAFTLIQVTCLSIAATFYPKHREQLIGLLEAAAGAGMMLGPLIGTCLFWVGGYVFMLVSLSLMFLVLSIIMPFILPKFLDQYTEQSAQKEDSKEEEISITTFSLLKTPSYLMAGIAGFLGYLFFDYFNPILGLRLLSMGLDEQQTGLFFCLGSFTYCVSSLLVGYLPKSIKKKHLIILGLLLMFPIQLLNGPSQLFGFPEQIWMMALGQILMGIVDPLILVFILPEMIDVVEKKFAGLSEKQKAKLADLSSGILNSFLGAGQISGPIYSSIFAKMFGYRLTCDVVALFALFFGIIYILATR